MRRRNVPRGTEAAPLVAVDADAGRAYASASPQESEKPSSCCVCGFLS